MKTLLRIGMAVAMTLAMAMPAMAKTTIGVCVTTADILEDATSSPVFFTAAAAFFPDGTIIDGMKNCPTTGSIGTFYTAGGFLAPTSQNNGNAAFVTWDFIFDKGGKLVTVGPVDLKADYTQTIVGANGGLPHSGKITVHNFSTMSSVDVAFAFSVTFP
jgi:hypothetical protein